MIGAFRPSPVSLGGLLWKNPWRLSEARKGRVRERLRNVDGVIAAVTRSGVQNNRIARMKSLSLAQQLPTEAEMLPRDKYTTFDRKSVGFRKSVHKVPKWTRLTLRVNPKGF